MATKTKTAPIDKEKLITSQLIALLESGTKPWHKPWKGKHNDAKAQNLITRHQYSGANPLFCMISNLTYGYDSPYYLTFSQAKSLGWFPKKGAKSTWIRFAGTGTKEIENEQGEATEQRFNFAKWSNSQAQKAANFLMEKGEIVKPTYTETSTVSSELAML